MTQPTTSDMFAATMAEHAERAERDPANRATAALAARLPYGGVRAQLDALRGRAFGLRCAVSKRFLDQLRRDAKKVPKPTLASFDGDLPTAAMADQRASHLDSGFAQPPEVELEATIAEAIRRLEDECTAVLVMLAALRRAAAATAPTAQLVPVRGELVRQPSTRKGRVRGLFPDGGAR